MCTWAMTSSSGASRRRVCGDWGASPALTSSRSSTSWKSTITRASSRCYEQPADRALRSRPAITAHAACDLGDEHVRPLVDLMLLELPAAAAGWRLLGSRRLSSARGRQSSIAYERPILNAVCSGRVSLNASARGTLRGKRDRPQTRNQPDAPADEPDHNFLGSASHRRPQWEYCRGELALRPGFSAQARKPPTARPAPRGERRVSLVLTAGPVPHFR